MIKYDFKPSAARYFFRNGCVDLDAGGLTFAPYANQICPQKEPGDIIIFRDYVDVDFTEGDFYKFLWKTCSSKKSFAKKALAIGYMLCNKLPRGGRRKRAFICANEEKGACANGKTLFTQAVSQFCNTVRLSYPEAKGRFMLSQVTENTQLVVIEDLLSSRSFPRFFSQCTDDWFIERRYREPLIIPLEKSPYLLLTAGISVDKLSNNPSFRRRFVTLDFSSFFGPDTSVQEYLGHKMFLDWDDLQWHMFDCFIIDCIMQYLYCSNGREEDIFSLYE